MAKLWAIVKREYIERVRTRWFIFATIFGPIFFGAMIIIPAVMAKKSRSTMEFSNTRIIDATKTGIGQRVAEAMSRGRAPGAASPQVVLVDPSELSQAESTATKEVMAKQISGYLITDESTLKGEELRYAGRNATSMLPEGMRYASMMNVRRKMKNRSALKSALKFSQNRRSADPCAKGRAP